MSAQDAAVQTYDPSEVSPVVGHRAYAHPVKLAASTTYVKGEILALPTANLSTLVYARYVTGASDGTQNAECILRRACITDSAGNITVGATSPGEFGATQPSISAWFGGVFNVADLTGTSTHALDSGAVTALGGKLQRHSKELSF
jgi:hypothetical protein